MIYFDSEVEVGLFIRAINARHKLSGFVWLQISDELCMLDRLRLVGIESHKNASISIVGNLATILKFNRYFFTCRHGYTILLFVFSDLNLI